MKKFIALMFMALLLTGCSGCAIFGGGGSTPLTQDQEVRIVVSAFQTALPTLYNVGTVYVAAQPQYQTEWTTVGIPAFIAVNKVLAGIEAQGVAGQPITITTVTTQLTGQMQAILDLYAKWQAVPSSSGGTSLTPAQEAMLIMTALNAGSVLIGEFSGNIPAWTDIQEQNNAFQMILTGQPLPVGVKLKFMK